MDLPKVSSNVGISSIQRTLPMPMFRRTDKVDNEGHVVYAWDISKDERGRLNRWFMRDFGELNIGGTYVTCPPRPCATCGKWTEFIDWVVTAILRNVHTHEFIFNALKNRTFPKENLHDVFCSACGTLTHLRSRNNTEGGATDVQTAAIAQCHQRPVP
ncbi:hypothetical protein BXZ70DRAFT_134572 [Cristinia sonorae]|uniref:Uncharacterized protein n=1 Tax=Cristinia sonorae TaxID=1940300 RepID=A0A8K0XQB0_9AGAR|nr:hypothetical protein BXZ70DRAFT_134572 [Cristinia sonorae]